MQKNSITNKISPCCNLPFSVVLWWVQNLQLNSEGDREFILTQLNQNGTISKQGWIVLINSATIELDSSLTKVQFLQIIECKGQPDCQDLKLIIEGFKVGNYNPIDEYGVGWTEVTAFESYDGKIIQKITNYVGGVGVMPSELSERIGLYFGQEILTSNKNLAVDFKPAIASAINFPDWTPIAFVANSMVFYEGKLYRSLELTTSSDVPDTSAKWEEKIGGVELSEIIDVTNTTDAISGKALYDFLIENNNTVREDVAFSHVKFTFSGYLNPFGNLVPNAGWSSTDFIPVEVGDVVTILLYGSESGVGAKAVCGYDSDKENPIPLISFPNDTTYNENLFSSSIVIERKGFVRFSDRSFNGFTNYSGTINQVITVEPFFLTQSSVKSVIDKLNETNPINGKAVSTFIGDFEAVGLYSGITTVNFTGTDFEDNFYYSPVKTPNENTKSLKLTVKKNEIFTYKGHSISGAPFMFFETKQGSKNALVGGWGATTKSFTTIIPEDGFLYINLNKTSIIDLFSRATPNFTGGNSLIDYINKDKRKLNPVKETILVSTVFDGLYVDVFNATEGTTTIYDNLTVNALYATSQFVYVQKGDKVIFTGYVGNEGLALYNSNGILISKLLTNNYGVNYNKQNVTIPKDGFIRASWTKSIGITLEIFRNNIPSDSISNSEESVSKTTKTFVRLSKPLQAYEIDFVGQLPTAEGVSSTVEMYVKENDRTILICNAKLTWQGQSSMSYPKKNFTLDLLNDAGEKLKLKIGDFIASDSFHLKGFQKEPTFLRDNLTSTLWYQIRKSGVFPDCRIDNLPNRLDDDLTEINYYEEDARFFADGFPSIMKNNGSFYGIYIFRLKKSMENYKIDKNLKTNIFLEYDYSIAGGAYVLLNWNTFVANQYEIKSPKMTGYVVGGTPPDTDVQNSINRLWAWTSLLYGSATKPANTATNVVLSAWIDYLIACEISNHWDGFNNNILLVTHDGLKWSPYIYDTDHTWGMELTFGNFKSTKSSFILDQNPRNDATENKQFWKNFRTAFNSEIKARYTELRNKNVISIQNIEKISLDFISKLSVEDYKNEHALWGFGQTPTLGKGNVRQVLEMANASINYVDSQWKI